MLSSSSILPPGIAEPLVALDALSRGEFLVCRLAGTSTPPTRPPRRFCSSVPGNIPNRFDLRRNRPPALSCSLASPAIWRIRQLRTVRLRTVRPPAGLISDTFHSVCGRIPLQPSRYRNHRLALLCSPASPATWGTAQPNSVRGEMNFSPARRNGNPLPQDFARKESPAVKSGLRGS